MLCDYNMYKQFGVGQKWKSWTIEMLSTSIQKYPSSFLIGIQSTISVGSDLSSIICCQS